MLLYLFILIIPSDQCFNQITMLVCTLLYTVVYDVQVNRSNGSGLGHYLLCIMLRFCSYRKSIYCLGYLKIVVLGFSYVLLYVGMHCFNLNYYNCLVNICITA